MAINPDPRPGRWILPLVVLGMVAFAYFFVRELPGADADTQTVTTNPSATSSTTTTTVEGSSSTTTTSLPVEVRAYLDSLTALEEQLTTFVTEIKAVNEGFDARPRTVEFNDANTRLAALADNVAAWETSVREVTAPSVVAVPHTDLINAASDAAQAAADTRAGLLRPSPDTGEFRRQSAQAFETAAAKFRAAADSARTLIAGSGPPA